jgi:hypothetical protein
MNPYRVVLDEAAFRALCTDKIVHTTIHHVPVDLELAVPWNRLLAAIFDMLAARLQWRPPADPPEAREFLPKRNHRK